MNRERVLTKTAASLLVVGIMSGCTLDGPALVPVAVEVPAQYTTDFVTETGNALSRAQKFVVVEHLPQQWWELFDSEEITRLITEGMRKSPSIKVAAARLRAAEAAYRAEYDSLQLPTVDGALNSSRQKGAAAGGSGGTSNMMSGIVEFNYEVDLFGRKDHQLDLSQSAIKVGHLQLQAAQTTLAANMVNSVVEIVSLREQIKAMEEIIADESAHLAVTEKQFQIGVIPKSDLLSQRAALADSRTELPVLHKRLSEVEHRLALLSGSTAGGVRFPPITLDALRLPQEVPVSLPSTLTRQRPEIQIVEEQLRQAAAKVGIATTNRYPTLSLSGRLGSEANQFADLLSGGTAVWGLGGGILHPLFYGKTLEEREKAAVAHYEEVAAQYRQQVLIAFREVADALRALQLDSEQLVLAEEADRLATETLEMVGAQQRQGAVSYLVLLNAQRQLQQSRIKLIQARAALYRDTTTLMVALGGGWWSEEDRESRGSQE